ncbi:MAG: hypothetical protein ABJK11_05680 [Balneola sp.]
MSTPLEQVLLRRNKSEMIQFLSKNPEHFDKAMLLAMGIEPPLCWRAAWLIGGVIKKNDPRIKPHIPKIIQVLPDRNDGHQRELLKILLKMDLTEDFESLLFDLSVNVWEQVRKQPSVRSFAFKGMVKVAEKYPELKDEVILLSQPQYVNPLSAGIRKGILKTIQELIS